MKPREFKIQLRDEGYAVEVLDCHLSEFEKIRVIEVTSKRDAAIDELVQSLQSLADYEFGINDRTGTLVRAHCNEALSAWRKAIK